MTGANTRRSLIYASLIVLLVILLIFYYLCSNELFSLITIPNLTIFGNMSFNLKQQQPENPTGGVVNSSSSLHPQPPSYNSELSEVNDDVLRQTSRSTVTHEGDKVAIIVPYRNRKAHLSKFLTRMLPFLSTQKGQYVIIITEQAGNRSFNRAKLFNVAVKEIRKSVSGDRLHGIDCFILHDVDKVPISLSTLYECGKNVRQLATAFRSETGTRWLYAGFLGAVTALSWDHLEKINGASNIFYGWGGEDDDLAIRLRLNNIEVDRSSNPDGIFDEFDPSHPREKNAERFSLTTVRTSPLAGERME